MYIYIYIYTYIHTYTNNNTLYIYDICVIYTLYVHATYIYIYIYIYIYMRSNELEASISPFPFSSSLMHVSLWYRKDSRELFAKHTLQDRALSRRCVAVHCTPVCSEREAKAEMSCIKRRLRSLGLFGVDRALNRSSARRPFFLNVTRADTLAISCGVRCDQTKGLRSWRSRVLITTLHQEKGS